METGDDLAKQLNQKLQSSARSRAYSYAKVLTLYWQDGHEDFRKEGQELGQMFKELFQYAVEEFAIPTSQSYLQLHNFVTQSMLHVIKSAEEKRGAPLLIIHYSGHGDQNDDKIKGEEKRSVWAA
jgi:hypothetical protein